MSRDGAEGGDCREGLFSILRLFPILLLATVAAAVAATPVLPLTLHLRIRDFYNQKLSNFENKWMVN